MAGIDPQSQTLVEEYLKCLRSKAEFDARLKAAKQKLLDYSQTVKKKTLTTANGSVTISVKQRTIFPKYNQSGRQELEAAVKDAGYWDESQSFDVIKLAEAFDNNRLPAELRVKLMALAKTEPQIRIFVNEEKEKK